MPDRRVDHALRRRNAALDILEGDADTRDFYRDVVGLFAEKKLPFLIGGTFALQRYTGIARKTKDIDFFIRRDDFPLIESTLRESGFKVELTYPHWLGKVFRVDDFADLAFRSANGEGSVDDEWFEHSVEEQLWGIPVRLCPPEETIWSKAFVMERERFDGADIIHILHATAATLDWKRLLRRFGSHWRILLMHLTAFGFVYPHERDLIPAAVMSDLIGRLQAEVDSGPVMTGEPVCGGTLISREQYLKDVHDWDYVDARLEPHGNLTREDIEHWTAAINR